MKPADRPYVSIVIPCYNEERNLRRGVLQEVHDYLETQAYAWEVIVVNDESTDASRELVAEFVSTHPRFTLHDIPHGGKPAAVWAGIQQARGEVVLFTDMDQSTPIFELEKLLAGYEEGFDVVIGSRGMAREGNSLLRQAGSVVFLTGRRLLILPGIRDTQCGFKLASREAALHVFPHLQYFTRTESDAPAGWKVSAYDVELLALLKRAGYTIQEVVVEWRNRDESDTKGPQGELARYAHESIEMLREVLRVKLNQLRGAYRDVER